MAKISVEHQEEVLTFPADTILELKIEEATTKTVPGRNGDWEKVDVKFKILGIQAIGDGSAKEDYENWITREIWGSVPFRLTDSPENKLRMWAEAIFRQELGLGFELDTDMFVGRKVRGITTQYNAKATDSQGNPFVRHQVESLLPFGGSAPAGAATAVPVPAAAPTNDPWGSDEPPF